jgi:tetratricopeptide (TPR) repeat protein
MLERFWRVCYLSRLTAKDRDKSKRIAQALKVRHTAGPAAALPLFRRLAGDYARDAVLRFHLAETLDNLGHESSAIPHDHRALRLDPKHRFAYENYLYLASSYRNVAKPQAARRCLMEAMKFGRSNAIQRRLERRL